MGIESVLEATVAASEQRREEFHALRRDFHAHPEPSNREFETAKRICRVLDQAGIPYRDGVAGTGIVADITGGAGPVVGLRADMDALEMTEETGLPYASVTPGVMHACGHDFHMASVLATALILHSIREQLPGCVKVIFQPAEENGPAGGAGPMLAEGALENPRPDVMFACHVAPDIPLGTVLVHDGATTASVDNFIITLRGKGGHAAYPHKTVDPVSMAAQTILGFNTLVARTVDSADRAVLSVGRIAGGSRRNIIPAEVELEGTMRTFTAATRAELKRRIYDLTEHYAGAAGGSREIQWFESFPATVNDPGIAGLARRGIDRVMGAGSVRTDPPATMAGEDFGKFLQAVPGALMWVGVGRGAEMNLHSSRLAIPDDGLDCCLWALLGATLAYFDKESNA